MNKETLHDFRKRKMYQNRERALAQQDFSGDKLSGMAKDIASKGLDAVKEASRDDITGEPDIVLKYIDHIGMILEKAQPILEMFGKGLNAAMATRERPVNTMAAMQPPEGWAGMSRMERLKYRFTRPEWYEAGCRYEQWRLNPSQLPLRNVTPPPIDIPMNPKQALLVQHQQSEGVHDFVLPESHRAPRHSDDALPLVDMEDGQKPAEQKLPEGFTEGAQAVVASQLEHYMGMAIDYLNGMQPEDFLAKLGEAEKMIEKYRPFLVFIPKDVRMSIHASSTETLVKLFSDRCKERWEQVKAAGKEKDIARLMDAFRAAMA